MRRIAIALVGTFGAALAGASLAGGAVGDLTEGTPRCISGETQSGFPFCKLIPSDTSFGSGSGLYAVESITVSPDGKSVYAAARVDHAIARFKRNRDSGRLAYRGCLSGDEDTPCRQIRSAVPGGAGSGLYNVRSLMVSRDGRFAYAIAADDDAVARFSRTRRGKLTYRGCLGGNSDASCREIPAASPNGTDSGLDHPKSATLSRDGKSLYVASTNDAAIARFSRNPRSGRLRYRGCITGETASGPAGSGACRRIAEANLDGDDSGLDDARGLALSPDQRWLYGVSSDDDAVFRFKRNRRSGKLAYRGCVSGESESSVACNVLEAGGPDGLNSGLDDLRALAISRDGKSVYVTSRGDDGVAEFRRRKRAGQLVYKRCHSGDLDAANGVPCLSAGVPASSGTDSGLDAPEGIVVSRDGRSVYVTTANDAGVARFNRSRRTGRLTFARCDSGDFETGGFQGTSACTELTYSTSGGDNTGIGFPAFLGLSPDDHSLYVAAAGDASVFSFERER